MMILIPRRSPRPDVAWWPGRRVLAAIDALAWPALWLAGLGLLPLDGGIIARVAMALLLVAAVFRLHRAVLRNSRYWFTTWRYGGPLALLVLLGALVKIVAGAGY